MNPGEFIAFSGTIAGRGPAGARSAVSRAYYGAFHLAADLLDEMNCGCPRNGKSHNLVPIFLKSSADANARKAGSLLSDLHSDRVKVDYNLERVNVETLAFAQTGVLAAQKIERLLATFRQACGTLEVMQDLQQGVAKVKTSYKI